MALVPAICVYIKGLNLVGKTKREEEEGLTVVFLCPHIVVARTPPSTLLYVYTAFGGYTMLPCVK